MRIQSDSEEIKNGSSGPRGTIPFAACHVRCSCCACEGPGKSLRSKLVCVDWFMCACVTPQTIR